MSYFENQIMALKMYCDRPTMWVSSFGWKTHIIKTTVFLNPGISCFENTVDPDQLASEEAI